MSLDWSSVKALTIPVGGVSRDVKRVTAGGVTLWEKAPPLPYDAEVEYIESTGTQYIDTGVEGVRDMAFTMDCVSLKPASASFQMPFSAQNTTGTGSRGYMVIVEGGTNEIKFRSWATTIAATGYIVTSGSRLSLQLDYGRLICNGSQYAGHTDYSGALGNVFLLCRNYNGTMQGFFVARIFSASISIAGVLVRDFVPVRVGSGANAVGCLYDKLGTGGQNPDGSARNDGLYFRQGSGAFVVGPDKNA